MSKTYRYKIDETTAYQRVDLFLRSIGYSGKLIKILKNHDTGLSIEESRCRADHLLMPGETLVVCLPDEETSGNIVATPMDLSVVYEDEDILVLDKAAGVPIHPSQGNYDNTLANGAAWYFARKGDPFVYRAVNRLDRDTTGLLILAKHMLSACILNQMAKRREIRREYLAVAAGRTPDEGTITAPISRVFGSTIERRVDMEDGEYALTRYATVCYNPILNFSLVRLCLETGRTHQIRVHLKYIGHPIPGDFLYHPDYRYINRQALHSRRLEFDHPITGRHMMLQSPLPDDMKFIFR